MGTSENYGPNGIDFRLLMYTLILGRFINIFLGEGTANLPKEKRMPSKNYFAFLLKPKIKYREGGDYSANPVAANGI